jgi:Asp-tRNA(Asn)/Glu-tRNA(Gln) amidotransferase A subunit family amidase
LGAVAVGVPLALNAQQARRDVQFEVHEVSITDLQKAMTEGRVTSAALVDAYLARIAAYDAKGPELNAMIRLNPRARADAAALDAERKQGKVRGPLHGIPIILKDNYDTADQPTSAGSLALANNIPANDAFVVERLKAAGAVILGKANMHELAAGITTVSSLGGQTRNPYDPRRCPGGSSGGTGVAIAASFAAVGWGSDTCGSIRIPSAFNSLFGLRPTQGMVSRRGIIPLSHTQDIGGPLARTVADLAIALDVTVGADTGDAMTRVIASRQLPKFSDSLSATALRGARLGLLTNYFTDIDSDIADTVRAAARAMKAAGAELVDVNVAGFDSLLANSSAINYETKFDLSDYLSHTPHPPVASLTEILDKGLYHEALDARLHLADTIRTRDSESYRNMLAKQALIRARMIAILDSLHLDALVYPTMRRRPAIIGEVQGGSTCALSAQTGLPALSAPAGFTNDGLPVGIELMGRPFADVRLVAIAFAYEQAGARRRPPPTTPALVFGRAPRPQVFTAVAQVSPGSARGSFTYDASRGELGYEVRVTGLTSDRIAAIVIQRADSVRGPRVAYRLAGPGVMHTSGSVILSAAECRALSTGRMTFALFTNAKTTSSGEAKMVLPGSAP